MGTVSREIGGRYKNPQLDIAAHLPYNTPIGNDGKKYPAMDA